MTVRVNDPQMTPHRYTSFIILQQMGLGIQVIYR